MNTPTPTLMNYECECGRPMPSCRTLYGCPHCTFLDGATSAAGAIIAALRRAGTPLTVNELAAENGLNPRSVKRALVRLHEAGRVRRFDTEVEIEQSCWTKGREHGSMLSTTHAWAYSLTEKRYAD